jgi:two-component system, NarL family, response regulator NreC
MTQQQKQFRVFLADDHAVVRAGVKALIERQPDMLVVGEATDGRTAVEQAIASAADLVVMDLSLPELNGLQAASELRRRSPRILIVALSVHEELSYLQALRAAGANGYVLKRSAPNLLIEALRSVAGGGFYVDPTLGELLGAQLRPRPAGPAAAPELSEREILVLQRLAQGYSNKEIAAQLNLSTRTVETYRARGMEKLGVENRVMLMRYALEQGWLRQV